MTYRKVAASIAPCSRMAAVAASSASGMSVTFKLDMSQTRRPINPHDAPTFIERHALVLAQDEACRRLAPPSAAAEEKRQLGAYKT